MQYAFIVGINVLFVLKGKPREAQELAKLWLMSSEFWPNCGVQAVAKGQPAVDGHCECWNTETGRCAVTF